MIKYMQRNWVAAVPTINNLKDASGTRDVKKKKKKFDVGSLIIIDQK